MKSFQIASLATVLLVASGASASPTGKTTNPYYTPGLGALKSNPSIQLDQFRNAVHAGIEIYRGHLNDMIATHEAFIAGKSNIAWWSDLGTVLGGLKANTLEIADNCLSDIGAAGTIREVCDQMSRHFQNAVGLTLPASAVMDMVFVVLPFEEVMDFQMVVLNSFNEESGAFFQGMRMMMWDVQGLPHPMPEPGREASDFKVLGVKKDLARAN